MHHQSVNLIQIEDLFIELDSNAISRDRPIFEFYRYIGIGWYYRPQ